MNLGEVIVKLSKKFLDKEAIIFNSKVFTYKTLERTDKSACRPHYFNGA